MSIEKIYESLFEASPDGIIVTDKLGKIQHANSQAERMFLYSKDALLGLAIEALIPQRFHEKHKTHLTNYLKKPVAREMGQAIPLLGVRSNGVEFSVEVMLNKIETKDAELISVFIRDITVQKKTADTLKENEERLRILVENAPEALVVIDVEYQKFILVSKSALKLFKMTQEELMRVGVIEISPEFQADGRRSAEAAAEKIRLAIDGSIPSFEWIHQDSQGNLIPCEITLVRLPSEDRTLVRGSIFDITERKRAEAVLLESEHFLDETQQIASLGTYKLDFLSGSWTSSIVLDSIFGIDKTYPHTIEGWTGLVHPDWQERILNYFLEDVIAKKSKFDKEYRIIRKTDGKERWVHGLGVLKFDLDGSPLSMVGTIRDISENKELEEALKSSVSLLDASLESTEDGILIVNREGSITKWNKKFAQMWMIPLELLNKEKDAVVMGYILSMLADPEKFVSKVKYLYDNPEESSFDQIIFLDGRIFERYSQAQKIGAKIVGRVWSFRDVTKRLLAEEIQRKSDEQLRMIFKTLSEGVALNEVIYNDAGEMIDHRIMAVNDSFYKVANYNKDVEVIGSLATELYEFTKEDIQWFWETHKDAIETTKVEFYSALKHRHFSVSVSPFKDNKFVTSFEDVTDRKKAEEALKESEEKYRTIFENVQDVFYQTNLQGVFLEISPSIKRLCGFSREEIMGASAIQLYDDANDREKLLQSILEKGELWDYEIRLKTKTGISKNVSVNARLIRDENGIPIQINGALRDLTERKKHELKIELQNKELEQFAYIASHDLQEPLHTLVSISELLREELQEDTSETALKYLEFINLSSGRMQELVKGLLDYSRIGKEREISIVDCNQLLTEVLADLGASIKDCEAKIKIENLPIIAAYATELRLLFQNLIGNALKFKNKEHAPEITISVTEHNDYWKFCVADNGIGIELADRQKIFTIFKRLHNRNEYSGTGIGLAHCKKIAELHGGVIWVEAGPKEGSRFYFTILKTS